MKPMSECKRSTSLSGIAADILTTRGVRETMKSQAHKIAGANAGEYLGFAEKLRVDLRHRPGVAHLWPW